MVSAISPRRSRQRERGPGPVRIARIGLASCGGSGQGQYGCDVRRFGRNEWHLFRFRWRKGGDASNTLKQAAEFGMVGGGQTFAGILMFLSDIHSTGLETAQGLLLTTGFYWDRNDGTRAFGECFAALNNGHLPMMNQAGACSATLACLEAGAVVFAIRTISHAPMRNTGKCRPAGIRRLRPPAARPRPLGRRRCKAWPVPRRRRPHAAVLRRWQRCGRPTCRAGGPC